MEHEVISNPKDVTVIMARYKELLALGRSQGFTPLIIVPNQGIYKLIKANGFNTILQDIGDTNPKSLLQQRLESLPNGGHEYVELDNNDEEGEHYFVSVTDLHKILKNKKAKDNVDFVTGEGIQALSVIILKIPTKKPWEVATYMPRIGIENLPNQQQQAAVFKYWYDTYGAIPAVMTYISWELYLQQPIANKELARQAATEHIAFELASDSIDMLTHTFQHATVWYIVAELDSSKK